MGRNLHVVNFTFTLVDEPQATSVAGHHTLAILEMSEHYDELSASLQDIADEVNDLNARVVWTIGVVFGHIQQNSLMVVGFEY